MCADVPEPDTCTSVMGLQRPECSGPSRTHKDNMCLKLLRELLFRRLFFFLVSEMMVLSTGC